MKARWMARTAPALAVALTLGAGVSYPDHKTGHKKGGGGDVDSGDDPAIATFRDQVDPDPQCDLCDPTFDFRRGDGLELEEFPPGVNVEHTVYEDVELQKIGGHVHFISGNFTMGTGTGGTGRAGKVKGESVGSPRKLVFDFSKPLVDEVNNCVPETVPREPGIPSPSPYAAPAFMSVNVHNSQIGLRDMLLGFPSTIEARVGSTFDNPDDSSTNFQLVCGDHFFPKAEPDRCGLNDYANVTCVAVTNAEDCTTWVVWANGDPCADRDDESCEQPPTFTNALDPPPLGEPGKLRCRLYKHRLKGKGDHFTLVGDFNVPFRMKIELQP